MKWEKSIIGDISVISIRPFSDNDNQNLLEIERLCPQGDENCALGVDKKDIITRYKMYKNWNMLVAEEEGKIAGWIGLTVKPTQASERNIKCGYITEVMVHPAFRRKGVATQLLKKAEEKALGMGSSYTYAYVYESNNASKSLFGKMGYSSVREIKTPAVPTYKESDISPEYSIKPVDKKEIGDAVGLINEYNSGFIHFVPFTAQTFEAHLKDVPWYGLENFWAVRDKNNKIVACAGLWDNSKLGNLYYAREPAAMKMMRSAFGVLSHITKVPKITAEREHLKLLYIADYAFDKRQPEAMLALLKRLSNLLIDMKQDYLMTATDPDDDFLAVTKKLKPQIETWNIFAKSFEGDLPIFSPFYIDIRDMIP
ncbi:GNAT family N-acetyltransferase [Methanosarcina sp. UBA5]|uniref:GNAT family N-acetyltransferase n=1 Tax=Methanosarcina sp. UBA5 TaxID=1915593 RepID=UPI0025D33B0D|nr:GNAT family N-acetyltransferase [Methanosarcina sp. UBA5]